MSCLCEKRYQALPTSYCKQWKSGRSLRTRHGDMYTYYSTGLATVRTKIRLQTRRLSFTCKTMRTIYPESWIQCLHPLESRLHNPVHKIICLGALDIQIISMSTYVHKGRWGECLWKKERAGCSIMSKSWSSKRSQSRKTYSSLFKRNNVCAKCILSTPPPFCRQWRLLCKIDQAFFLFSESNQKIKN